MHVAAQTNSPASYRISPERLWTRINNMARFGATPAGGCNRQALTDEDKAGRECFISWCKEAGCSVSIDAVGNIFARREGSGPELPPVMTGSHLDTQPSGGKYDGIYGVLAGLEVIEALNDLGVVTEHPIELVVWTNEEGCRFDTAMMGSAVWSGSMSLEAAYSLQDRKGNTVLTELKRTGFLGDVPAQHRPVHAAFELHIEQGPVLEAESLEIGVVTGVQHMSRYRVLINGTETHAGPSPMSLRRDPVMALARILPELYSLPEREGDGARVTIGYMDAQPGSSNTVPGRMEFTVDLRHPESGSYARMIETLHSTVAEVAQTLEMEASVDCFWDAPGVTFDSDCVDAVRKAVATCGYSNREMVSGAGHDACNLAAVAPTSMIFVPCEGGLSHNEAEAITQQQAEAGANVLLQAMLEIAKPNLR